MGATTPGVSSTAIPTRAGQLASLIASFPSSTVVSSQQPMAFPAIQPAEQSAVFPETLPSIATQLQANVLPAPTSAPVATLDITPSLTPSMSPISNAQRCPMPAPTSTPRTNSSAPTASGGCPDPQGALAAHNAIRAQTGASPLSWSSQLTDVAQAWADRCVFEHSGNGYGENLAEGVSNCADAVHMWVAEGPGGLNHYTQVGVQTVLGAGSA